MGSTPIWHSVLCLNSVLNVKAVVAAFNQEKALLGAFSVITNLRMELFEALLATQYPGTQIPTLRGGVSQTVESALGKLLDGLPLDLVDAAANIQHHRVSGTVPPSVCCAAEMPLT